MKKISMMGLIFGLLILGILFFVIGFLVASTVNEQKISCTPPLASAWASASQSHIAQDLVAQAQRKASSFTSGLASGSMGGIAGGVLGSAVTHFSDRQNSSPHSPSFSSEVLQSIPSGIRPFAIQAYNQSMQRTSGAVNRTVKELQGPFQPKSFGQVPPTMSNQTVKTYGRPSQTRPVFEMQQPYLNGQQPTYPVPSPYVQTQQYYHPQTQQQIQSSFQFPSHSLEQPDSYYAPQNPVYAAPMEPRHQSYYGQEPSYPAYQSYSQQFQPQPYVSQSFSAQPQRFVPMG